MFCLEGWTLDNVIDFQRFIPCEILGDGDPEQDGLVYK